VTVYAFLLGGGGLGKAASSLPRSRRSMDSVELSMTSEMMCTSLSWWTGKDLRQWVEDLVGGR